MKMLQRRDIFDNFKTFHLVTNLLYSSRSHFKVVNCSFVVIALKINIFLKVKTLYPDPDELPSIIF